MGIAVITTEGMHDNYRSAVKWVIDDAELLHIVGDKGNLASYNRGQWLSVHHKANEDSK